jgi:pyruvate dehydrogenase E1 component
MKNAALVRKACSPASGETPECDNDPGETREWIESFDAVAPVQNPARARFLLRRLEEHAQERGLLAATAPYSAYRNTIPVERQGSYPGDLQIEEHLTAIMRWNALAMVVRANKVHGELGGHIASYASAAEIFEVGFNHSSRPRARVMAATSSTSNRIPRPASTRAPSSKVA